MHERSGGEGAGFSPLIHIHRIRQNRTGPPTSCRSAPAFDFLSWITDEPGRPLEGKPSLEPGRSASPKNAKCSPPAIASMSSVARCVLASRTGQPATESVKSGDHIILVTRNGQNPARPFANLEADKIAQASTRC